MKLRNLALVALTTIFTLNLSAQKFSKGDKLITIGVGSGGEQPNQIWVSSTFDGSNLILENDTRTYDLKSRPRALSFNGQYFLSPMISIGAYLSPTSSRAEVSGIYRNFNYISGDWDNDTQVDDRYTKTHSETRTLRNYYFGAKCEVHLAHKLKLDDKWDTYTGLSIGSAIKRERVTNRKDFDNYEYNVNKPGYYTSTSLIPNSENENYSWSPATGNTASLFIGVRYFFADNLGVGLELGIPNGYAHLSLAIKL